MYMFLQCFFHIFWVIPTNTQPETLEILLHSQRLTQITGTQQKAWFSARKLGYHNLYCTVQYASFLQIEHQDIVFCYLQTERLMCEK